MLGKSTCLAGFSRWLRQPAKYGRLDDGRGTTPARLMDRLLSASVLIFDEAVARLDDASAAHIAQTVNQLRGKVTMLFITHKVPAGLHVDAHVHLTPTASPAAVAGVPT